MAIGRPIELTPNIATKNISSLATADQTEFTVTGGYRINEIAVYRNGVRLAEGRDFTASDGDTVNLVTAATVDDVIEFAVFDSFNVSDAIVSAASSQNLNGDFNVTGILYAGTFEPGQFVSGIVTANTALYVGSALTSNAAGDVETIGIITASSFSGDGSSLTGVANTDYVVSVATTTGNLNVSAAATITGILTTSADAYVGDALDVAKDVFVGAAATIGGVVKITDSTSSTSTTTGALIVSGGAGIAGDVWVGAGLSVAGTLTYEDVTSVDSVGLITAKSGVNITGGQLTVGSGITMGIAGVATFSGTADIHLLDNVKLNVGDGSDLSIYHNGTHSFIEDSGTGVLALLSNGSGVMLEGPSSGEYLAKFNTDGAVELYWDNSKKFETTNDGTVTTGIGTFTEGLRLADNKQIKFGTGDDSGMYYTGSHLYIDNNTAGDTYIRSTNLHLQVNSASSSENAIVATANGAVQLYYNGSEKLSTASTAVSIKDALQVEKPDNYWSPDTTYLDIAGYGNLGTHGAYEVTLTAGGYRKTVGGSSTWEDLTINSQSGYGLQIALNPTDGNIIFRTESGMSSGDSTSITERLRIGSAGISTFSNTPHDDKGSLRDIPLRSVTSSAATLVAADAGKVVSTDTTGWTVPASTFDEGDTVTLLNNSAGGLVITCSAVTTYLTSDGTTVTSKTLGARGLATLYFVSSSVAYLQGTSLS